MKIRWMINTMTSYVQVTKWFSEMSEEILSACKIYLQALKSSHWIDHSSYPQPWNSVCRLLYVALFDHHAHLSFLKKIKRTCFTGVLFLLVCLPSYLDQESGLIIDVYKKPCIYVNETDLRN